MQENVVFGTNSVTGTLHYIDDYSSAFGPDEDSGNYIVFHAEVPDFSGATITATMDNTSTLDSDGIAVFRVRDKSTQTLTVVASATGYDSVTRTYSLSGLTCEQS